MILTCSECASRYFVDDARIGPKGRKVRCASCGHAWVQAPVSEDEPSADQWAPAAAASVPAVEASADKPLGRLRSDVSAKLREAAAEKRKTREAAAVGAVWAVLGVSFCLLMLGAVVFRTDVVRLMPQTAGAYAFVRMPVNPTGLDISLHGAMGLESGRAALIVTGALRNVEAAPREVLPIRVILLDHAGKRLASQVIPAPGARLAPGESQPIRAVFYDPPLQAVDAQAEFAFDQVPRHKAEPKPAAHAVATPPSAAMGLRGSAPIEMTPAPKDAAPLPAGSPYALPPAEKAAPAPPTAPAHSHG